MNSSEISSDTLNALMERAADGERAAIEEFYRSLLQLRLYVPERYQSKPLSHAPPYPNELFSLLGIKDGSRSIIPVFTSEAGIEQWCGQRLTARTMTGAHLFSITPPEWWIAVNPHADVSKDLSPWEVDLLRGGEPQIQTLLQELSVDAFQDVQLEEISASEECEIKDPLATLARQFSVVRSMHLVREVSLSEEGEAVTALLLGVFIHSQSSTLLSSIEQQFKTVVDRLEIGRGRIKLLCGTSPDSLTLGMFKGYKPFYERTGTLRFISITY